MIILVNPVSGETVTCEREAPRFGWAWGIGGQVAVEHCAKQYQNLGFIKSDDLTPDQRDAYRRVQAATEELRQYWRTQLRPAVMRGDLLAVEAARRLNEREEQFFPITGAMERLQHYRLALGRLVDQRKITLEDAERYEVEARVTGKFLPIPPEVPVSEEKRTY